MTQGSSLAESQSNTMHRDRFYTLSASCPDQVGIIAHVSNFIAQNGGWLLESSFHADALTGRYFMPHACHSAFAITGAVAVGTAAVTPGTVIAEVAGAPRMPVDIVIEHPSGRMQVRLEQGAHEKAPVAFVVRTARRLFEGRVLVNMRDKVSS